MEELNTKEKKEEFSQEQEEMKQRLHEDNGDNFDDDKIKEEIRLQEEQIKGEEIELNISKEEIQQEKDFVRQEKKEVYEEIKKTAKPTDKLSESPAEKEIKKTPQQKIIGFFKNTYNVAFLLILLAAFLIRLKYIGQESLWNDAAVHLWYAIKVTKEPLFLFSREYLLGGHVLPQTIIAFFYLFTKNAFIAGKIVAILFGMVGVIFMYLLGTELRDKFTGLLGAALLGFNHLLWFYGVRPLADGPLTVVVVLVIYAVVKLEKTRNVFYGLFAVAALVLALLTKQAGVLYMLAFLIYILLFKRKEAIRDKAILYSWLLCAGLIVFASLVFKSNFFFDVIERFYLAAGLKDGTILHVFSHLKWIFSWYLLIPLFLGIILLLLYRKKEYYFLLMLFVFTTIYFEVGVKNIEDRIVMPLLSAGIILAVFSLTEIARYLEAFTRRKMFRYVGMVLVLAFVGFVCWHFYGIGDPLIESKSTSYAGHQEAGQWLKQNVPSGTPIFVGSPRMQRTFIEREYGGPGDWDKGGSLWYLRANEYLNNRSAFEKDLAILSKKSDVYLEIDVWEYTQPNWYFPLSQKSLDYFVSKGFQLIKVMERETRSGSQKRPVIFLFKKNKEG